MVILSVCPSVTTRCRFRTSRDRDFGFSLYDSLVSLVFRDKISCNWVKGVPTNEGAKKGHPSLKNVTLPLLASLTWKWLQIGTDMLLNITSTGNELLRNVNIVDLEWPWTPKILILSDFLAICGCKRVNCDEMNGDRPKLSANKNCHGLSRVSWALAQISC